MAQALPQRAIIRDRMKLVRESIEPRRRKVAADMVAAFAAECPVIAAAKTVMLYAPVGAELDTKPLVDVLRAQGKEIALPRLLPDRQMEPVFCNDFDLPKDKRGICVPGGAAYDVASIDLIFVPGLAFDRKGGRLGYGAGYYDRFLPRTRAKWIGLCYEEQYIDALPLEPHDVNMHAVLSPKGLFWLDEEEMG